MAESSLIVFRRLENGLLQQVAESIDGEHLFMRLNGYISGFNADLPPPPTLEGGGGADGKSAYQVWLDLGNTGTEAQFIASLKGEPGAPGEPGEDGADGSGGGTAGKSAYQIWLDLGNTGTEADFIASLKGPPGEDGEDGTSTGGGTTINITGGTLPKPTNTAELQALADAAAANSYVVVLAPGTKITLTDTIVFRQPSHDGSVWGMDCSWAQLDWAGPAGAPMVKAEGVSGAANRGFVFINAQLYGGGYWTDRGRANQAGVCLLIDCPGGDSMAFYKATLHNIYTSYAGAGFQFRGAVFEFAPFNLHAENHTGNGMEAVSVGGAVMSNVFNIAPNMSRNGGSGIYTGYSHNVLMGSFIQNSRYGIEAPDGLRVAAFNNGENTGESLIKLGYDGYGSVIFANEMSTGYVGINNEGASSTGYSKYVLDAPAGNPMFPNNTDPKDNHVAGYGGAVPSELRVRK